MILDWILDPDWEGWSSVHDIVWLTGKIGSGVLATGPPGKSLLPCKFIQINLFTSGASLNRLPKNNVHYIYFLYAKISSCGAGEDS